VWLRYAEGSLREMRCSFKSNRIRVEQRQAGHLGGRMELSNVVFTQENQIGFVVLNRPQVHNALNHALFLDMIQG
jgi:hypothetical protein